MCARQYQDVEEAAEKHGKMMAVREGHPNPSLSAVNHSSEVVGMSTNNILTTLKPNDFGLDDMN